MVGEVVGDGGGVSRGGLVVVDLGRGREKYLKLCKIYKNILKLEIIKIGIISLYYLIWMFVKIKVL